MCNPHWLASQFCISAHFAKPGVSDDVRMEIEIHDHINRRDSFKYLNVWAEHPTFLIIDYCTECWGEGGDVTGCAMYKVFTKLKHMKEDFKRL